MLNGPSASHAGPLWVWQIPPLTTNTLFDEEHLPQVPPVLMFQEPVSSGCHKPDQWYYDDLNSLPLYFDVFERGDYGDFTRCKLDIASDLSDLSLVPVADLCMRESIGHTSRYHLVAYRICEDRPVNVYNHYMQLETYTRLTSSGTTVGSPTIDVNVHGLLATSIPKFTRNQKWQSFPSTGGPGRPVSKQAYQTLDTSCKLWMA